MAHAYSSSTVEPGTERWPAYLGLCREFQASLGNIKTVVTLRTIVNYIELIDILSRYELNYIIHSSVFKVL